MIDEKSLINKLNIVKNGFINKDKLDSVKLAYVIEKIIELLKSEPKVGEWIPCSKRLPKHYGQYLITAINDYEGIYMAIASYDSQYKSFSSDGVEDDNAIAWMDLPKMYEVKRK